jgi:hypothetical protein
MAGLADVEVFSCYDARLLYIVILLAHAHL